MQPTTLGLRPRKLRRMNRLLLCALAVACLAATATASAATPKFVNRTVTVKVAGSMKTTWKAAPVADPGCQGKPSGYLGSGTETIEWSQAKVLKGQLTGQGEYFGLMVTDRKGMPTSKLPISGTVQRSGNGQSVACGEVRPDETGPCVGKKNFDTDMQLAFLTGRRFTLDDPNVTMTSSLYPDCEWVWDGMVVRTGAVLLNVGMGKFDPKRLAKTKSSVTLKTHDEKRCQDEGADDGVECTTVTDWRITFYPARKKRR
jgi:hypothetical protein